MTKEMLDLTPATAHSIFSAKKHKMVARGLLVAAMAVGLAFAMAMPASAGTVVSPTGGGTAVTFELTGGDLTLNGSSHCRLDSSDVRHCGRRN